MSRVDVADLEPELEALCMRLVPDMATRWHSAAVQDIAAIEAARRG